MAVLDPSTLCDLEAEQGLLGSALIDPAVADEYLARLPDSCFAREAHRRIWAAVRILRSVRSVPDALTVADALQASGDWGPVESLGGLTYLADLMTAVPAAALVRQYADLVAEGYARRTARSVLQRALEWASDPSRTLESLYDEAASLVGRLAGAAAGRADVDTLDVLASRAWEEAERVYRGEERAGISTGLDAIDAWTGGGLHRGELWILGGRPGVGKSSLAQQIAASVARGGGIVLLASAEMLGQTVGQRALAAESGVDGRRLRGSPRATFADWEALAKAIGVIARYGGSVFVDTHSRTMGQIAAQARRLHAREPVALVVIDHLQQLRVEGRIENRTQAVGEMATAAKDLATSLDCSVLCLSQLNRQAPSEKRRPRPSDLRDSGVIEQVADTVVLMHREEDAHPSDPVQIIFAKHRNGELGSLPLFHDRPTGRWRGITAREPAEREGVRA